MTPRVKDAPRFTAAGLRLLLTSVIAVSAGVVLTVPVPVLPQEPPTLVVTRAEDAAARRADERAAAGLPRSPELRALRESVLEAGRRELHESTSVVPMDEETDAFARTVRAVERAHGRAVLARFRAALALEAERTLAQTHRSPEGRALLGGFPVALEAWGVTRGGTLVASPLVARALYKARLAVVLRAPPTEGLSRSETRAYLGWLAMHGRPARIEQRIEAATALSRIDGSRETREMLAFAMLAEGSDSAAMAMYARLAEETGSIRIRNHARAVALVAGR